MTAISIVAQPKHGLIHLATDAASYSREHTVAYFAPKVATLPHFPAALAAIGNAAAPILYGTALSESFSSFDDFCARADSELPQIVTDCTRPGATPASVIVVGISAERGPEAYVFHTDLDPPSNVTREEMEASPLYSTAGKLIRLPAHVSAPTANDQVEAARFEGFDLEADPDTIAWSLRKLLVMQRHTREAEGIGAIGGFGLLTSVSVKGIEQRVVVRWPDDRVGKKITPSPINWDDWHRDNPKPLAGARLRVVG